MAVLPVPGFTGNWVVDTNTMRAWRVGREGGVHTPDDYRNFSPEFTIAANGVLGEWRASQNFGPSEDEQRMMDLQMASIEKQMQIMEEQQRRENERRKAYARWISGERWDPKNQEEQEGQQGARAAEIAELEGEQLTKALRGELPVTAGTARAIRENRDIINERLRRNLGEGGWEAGTPGGEALGRFEESSQILKEADQQGLINRGIRPAIDAAGLARESIGEYQPQEVPGLNAALQSMRQASVNRAELSQRSSRSLEAQGSAYIQALQKLAQSASSGSGMGGGIGRMVGGILGGLATAAIPYAGPFLAPLGSALGSATGGLFGSAASGGGWSWNNLYGTGGTGGFFGGGSRTPAYGGGSTYPGP